MRWFRLRRCMIALVAITFLLCMLLGIHVITEEDRTNNADSDRPMWLDTKIEQDQKKFGVGGSQLLQKLKSRPDSDEVLRMLQDNRNVDSKKVEDAFQDIKDENEIKHSEFGAYGPYPVPNYNVHVFYYVWYGNPKHDKQYLHWNHQQLPHWDKKVARKYSTDYHVPPDDIGSNFYPELGPYSSRDPKVIEDHMKQIRSSGAGVLAVSWYPPGLADDNGEPWDDLMPTLMNVAHQYQLKVCFHIEPFTGRTASTIKQWITYIMDTYGSHPAFYKFTWKGRELPLYYLYDSYQVSTEEWQQLLLKTGSQTLRNTAIDAHFIGLLVEKSHQDLLHRCGFDGYYTYFASDGFTHGSTTLHWMAISQKARENNEIFIPSIGPGYIDERVRPWNKPNTKDRQNGHYFEESFEAAIGCSAPVLSITSFNEWHEGTQIEKAVSKQLVGYKYLDYNPQSSDFYLELTNKWIERFSRNSKRS